jgi:hypothetical protein
MEFLIECGQILLPLCIGFTAGIIPYYINRNKRYEIDKTLKEQEA